MFEYYITQNTKITHKLRKSTHNHEIWSEKEKAHNFSLKIWGWNESKMEVCSRVHGKFESFSGKEEDEQSEMFEGKLKRFKNWPFMHKTRDFRDWIKSRLSRQVQLPEHLKGKLLKNFLSVFRNWKFPSREGRELSRENLYVPLAIGPSIRKQVANLSREKYEKTNFWKIF